jgi:hypothetical protein
MKYMLLINNSRQTWEEFGSWSPDEIKTVTSYMDELMSELTASGEMVDGQGLGGPARMKVVRADRAGGDALVTDGPMAEAKEFLAGYLEVDVSSLDRAIEIAERMSAAPGRDGSPGGNPIEVHPVMGAPDEDVELLAPYRK